VRCSAKQVTGTGSIVDLKSLGLDLKSMVETLARRPLPVISLDCPKQGK
jgi:hypothetical protein